MTLTARENATVLAALRFWQNWLDPSPREIPVSAEEQKAEAIERMPDHFQDREPLVSYEIDALCSKINEG